MQITLTKDEAYLVEKMCDDQASAISGRLHTMVEQFLVMRASIQDNKKREMLSKLIMGNINEWVETTALLNSIRTRFETKRRGNVK